MGKLNVYLKKKERKKVKRVLNAIDKNTVKV